MSNAIIIADLVQRLEAANMAYRNSTPIMSDAAFDALEAQLRGVAPNHPYFQTVGAPPAFAGGWTKVRHSIAMGSLDKVQTPTELNTWYPKYRTAVTQKLDGISVSLFYQHRRLVQALTRGDGEVGEDITRNVMLMKGVVKVLPPSQPAVVYVRGEIVCRKSDFQTHFQGDSNPRNTASGTSKRQSDNSKCQFLTVVAYQILPDGVPLATKSDEIRTLTDLGFTTPECYVCQTYSEILDVYDSYVSTKRAALDWEIDGLVIDVDDRDTRESLGETNMRPKGAVAFKFPHEQKCSILQDIAWQVGASGRVTPVALFDEVVLGGARVTNASLHNVGQIAELVSEARKGETLLRKGDQIMVSRRNDVIPYVETIIANGLSTDVLAIPTHCPECKTTLTMVGEYLICPNTDTCPAQVSGAIKRWLDKIGVLHFGGALVDMLCESGKVETIADLYELDPAEVATMGMGGRQVGGTATKAFKNLHASKTLPLHLFVGSLGIQHIGRSMAKVIVDAGFDSLRKMSQASVAQIAAIPGMGQTKAEAFCDGFWDLLDRGIIVKLMKHITIADKAVGALSGKSVCMTGFRDKQMEQAVEAAGGTLKSSVSKDLTILVAKDTKSTSGKAEQANKYGVTIMSIEDMWKMLGGKP